MHREGVGETLRVSATVEASLEAPFLVKPFISKTFFNLTQFLIAIIFQDCHFSDL